MTKDKAIEIAKEHSDKENRESRFSEKIKLIISECKEYEEGFYFDYSFERLDPNDKDMYGGAPGYMVLKESGEVKIVSWQEMNQLLENK